MPRRIKPLALVLAIAVAACASPPTPKRHYEKAGAGQAELDRDSAACMEKVAAKASEAENPRYEHQVRAADVVACMKELGWRVVEE